MCGTRVTIKQILKLIFLFAKYTWYLLAKPLLHSFLTIWDVGSDYILAYKYLSRGDIVWGILTACMPFVYIPWMLVTHLVSRLICLDLWLAGKPFKRPVDDEHFKNGYIKGSWWMLIPGVNIFFIWKSHALCWQSLTQMFKLEKEMMFNDKEQERILKEKKSIEWFVSKSSYRAVRGKFLEILFESIAEIYLQLYIALIEAESIDNLIPYLQADIKLNGPWISLSSAILSSFFSAVFFLVFSGCLFIYVEDDLHLLRSKSAPLSEKIKWVLYGCMVGPIYISASVLILVTKQNWMVSIAILSLHFLLFVPLIRQKWGKEDLSALYNLVYLTLIGAHQPYNPKTKASYFIWYGSCLSYATGLFTILWLDYIDEDGSTKFTSPEFRYACLILATYFVLVTPVFLRFLKNNYRYSSFRMTCISGDMEVLEIMYLSQSVDFNDIDFCQRNGFILACEYDQYQVVKFILEKQIQIDYNQQNVEGQTGLHVAAAHRNYDILALIMQHSNSLGIDLNIKDNEGKTAFQLAEDLFRTSPQSGLLELKPILVHVTRL